MPTVTRDDRGQGWCVNDVTSPALMGWKVAGPSTRVMAGLPSADEVKTCLPFVTDVTRVMCRAAVYFGRLEKLLVAVLFCFAFLFWFCLFVCLFFGLVLVLVWVFFLLLWVFLFFVFCFLFVCFCFVLPVFLLQQETQEEIVNLWDGFARTIVRAATLRQKLQIILPISPSHCILARPTSPSAGATTPGTWQSSHWSAKF